MPVDVELLPAVAYDRPDQDGLRPIPAGYTLDRLTVMRADQVSAGDLVVGSVDQLVTRSGSLRWATYRAAPFIAQPGPYEADCANCRAWISGAVGPWVTLFPHVPEHADDLIAIVPPDVPWTGEVAVPCAYTCTCHRGRVPVNGFHWPNCGECHGRPCAPCGAAGRSTH